LTQSGRGAIKSALFPMGIGRRSRT
jgi:hypothetical protein